MNFRVNRQIIFFILLPLVFVLRASSQVPFKLVLPLGNNSWVSALHFSPDQKHIVTASYDKIIKIWDANTGLILASMTGHDQVIMDIQYSPDGKYIVSGSFDRTVKLWDARSGTLVYTFAVYDMVQKCQFTFDNEFLIVACNSAVKVWRVSTKQLIRTISPLKYPGFKILPDNKRLLIRNGNSIILYNFYTGISQYTLTYGNDDLSDTDISDDGSLFFALSTNGQLVLSSTETGKTLLDMSEKNIKAKQCAFSHTNKEIVIITMEGKIQKWDKTANRLRDEQYILTTINDEWIQKPLYSRNDKYILFPFGKNKIKVLNNLTKQFTSEWSGDFKGDGLLYLVSGEFSHDGSKVLLSEGYGSASIWDVQTGGLIRRFKGHASTIMSLSYNKACKSLAVYSKDGYCRIIDPLSGKLNYAVGRTNFSCSQLSENCKYVLADYADYTTPPPITNDSLMVIDVETGQPLLTIRENTGIEFSKLSYDVRYVAWKADKTIKVWDLRAKKVLFALPVSGTVYDISLDSKHDILVVTKDFEISLWNLITGNKITTITVSDQRIIGAKYYEGSDLLFGYTQSLTGDSSSFTVWNTHKGELVFRSFFPTNAGGFFDFDPQGLIVTATATSDNSVRIFDAANWALKKTIYESEVYPGPLKKAKRKGLIFARTTSSDIKILDKDLEVKKIIQGEQFDLGDEENYFVVVNNDRLIFFGYENLTPLFDFISLDKTDYLAQLPSRYYMASANASKLLHYVTPALKSITFEQLDVKYNRPDMLLEAIGNADTALIRAYRNAYLKRIAKLNINITAFTDEFSLPEADFTNRDSISYERTNRHLTLHISGKSFLFFLDRFNVWINETPLFGTKGYNLRNKNLKYLDTTLTVELSDSLNRIETSVTDANGMESYRMPLQVNYISPKKTTAKNYFIGIGIDTFKDSSHNLTWSVIDIRNLADSLKSKYKGNITIDTLFNNKVTVDKVKALKQSLYKTNINDKVIVAYSGHGLLSDSFNYYLSTWSVNFDKPEEDGLSYDILEDLLDSIPARNKLMLLDACHSGEIDKEEMQHYRQVQAKLDDNGVKKGTILENTDSTRLGMKNSFELMRQLFVNVGRSTGATVISAAAGTQFALEKNNLKDGVFTYSILEYMSNHKNCTVVELKEYVNKRVSELTEGLQQPTARTENVNYDWKVW